MRTLLPILLIAVLPACDAFDSAGPALLQCNEWATCDGALTVHSEVVSGSFGRQRPDLYMPGDSVLLRFRIQNRARITSDSLMVEYAANGLARFTRIGDPVVVNGGWVEHILVLDPGEIREFVDTVVVGGYTFGDATRLNVWAYQRKTFAPIDLTLSGDREFPVATSGYTFEVVVEPPGVREVVQHGNHSHNATRIRHKTDTGVLVRISNPYQVPLEPMTIGHCLWDGDHGYVCDESVADMPRLETGREAYVEYVFNFDTEGHYHDWWGRDFTELTICPEEGFGWNEDCRRMDILVTANFEADCTVVIDAPVGLAVRDETPECGRWRDGSAYRFTARKGERYKALLLSTTGGEVFLSTKDGVHYTEPHLTELSIPEDGTYYVVILHQNAVRFRLDKVN